MRHGACTVSGKRRKSETGSKKYLSNHNKTDKIIILIKDP